MKQIVLWGAIGQAIVVEEFLQKIGFQLIALFDNNPDVLSPFPKVPIYHGVKGFEKWKKENDSSEVNCLVTIGGSNGKIRLELQEFMEKEGLKPVTVIHPTSFVASSSKIGKGSQVMANTAICARVEIGKASLINTSSSIDHECIIGDGVHIGPGAKLAGCVTVGDGSFIGTGAIVIPRIKIGKNAVIGAGAVVTKDIPDDVVAYGNPAKIKRSNKDE